MDFIEIRTGTTETRFIRKDAIVMVAKAHMGDLVVTLSNGQNIAINDPEAKRKIVAFVKPEPLQMSGRDIE